MSIIASSYLSRSLSLLFVLVVAGCTWVQPLDTSTTVAVAAAAEVENCQRLGTTTSSVKDQIGWFNRSESRVASELLTLAQNAAFTMGGNTLVATAEPMGGSQHFVIYSCADM